MGTRGWLRLKKLLLSMSLLILATVAHAANPSFKSLIIPKDGSGAKYNALVGYNTITGGWQFINTKKLADGTFVLDLGTITIQTGADGGVSANIKPWIVNGTPTITIPAGQTMTITIPTQPADYWLSAINISGYGGDAKITVSLPSPHYGRVARISPTEPNVNIDFGESIKIYSGTAIAIKIKSTDFEIGQVVDISWQTSSL